MDDIKQENINLEIKKGQKVAFVGKSGAGKTTFANLLLNFYEVSSGKILENEFQSIVNDLVKNLLNVLPVDGILLALHGAWVSEKFDSADGYVLECVRKVVGNEIPIVVSLDLHANISKTFLDR